MDFDNRKVYGDTSITDGIVSPGPAADLNMMLLVFMLLSVFVVLSIFTFKFMLILGLMLNLIMIFILIKMLLLILIKNEIDVESGFR